MGRLFGTDGVRGLAGTELTAELATALGRAAVSVLCAHGTDRPRIVVGRDPRESGTWLEEAISEGIAMAGGDVLLAGIEPTPAIAFLTTDAGASAGAVISASHNPPEYNGIKFFSSSGMKLPDALEDEIETLVFADGWTATRPAGVVRELEEGRERYLEHLVGAAEARLGGMKVVVDCANGAASDLAPELMRRLGADVHVINASPNGLNINDGCGALHPDVVAAEVVRLGADVGVSHDGDADRALFCDQNGEIIDGDQVIAACAVDMHKRGTLDGNLVITTVMANVGFHHAMRDAGIEVVSSKVGDRYVLEDMLRTGASLGGEQSGHVIFRHHATTGDGLLTAAKFLSLIVASGGTASEAASVMRRYPQRLINVVVRDRDALEGAEQVWQAVRETELRLGSEGRVLVRASGTEPLVRVMVEAETESLASDCSEMIAKVVEASIGV